MAEPVISPVAQRALLGLGDEWSGASRSDFGSALQLASVLAILLAWRVACMLFSSPGLHVDEAQYWDWSRQLQWGYFSKPPGVAAGIAASTALFGDGLFGIRVWAMASWLVASAVLWRLGTLMGSRAAGFWAALLLVATPASNLLGLVATTDAPLMLFWALAMLASWLALAGPVPHRKGWWVAAGLACGLGLLSKYTMGAILLSGLWLALLLRRGDVWRGLLIAACVALLCLVPNLVWNAAHGWPTLRHTAEITVSAANIDRAHLSDLGLFAAGQWLLAGPAFWWVAVRVWLARRGAIGPGLRGRTGTIQPETGQLALARQFAAVFALPLLALTALQALRSGAQMNWSVPALLGACLWLGLQAARWQLPEQLAVGSTLAGLALGTAIVIPGPLLRLPTDTERPVDIWQRMRGWDAAFQALQPQVAAHPKALLAATARDTLAQAAHAWPTRPVASWGAGTLPRHHYDMALPVSAGAARGEVLLITNGPPTGLAAGRSMKLLVSTRAGGETLQLWHLAAEGVAP